MNDWVNCLRLVAFGQSASASSSSSSAPSSSLGAAASPKQIGAKQNHTDHKDTDGPSAGASSASLAAASAALAKRAPKEPGEPKEPHAQVDVLLQEPPAGRKQQQQQQVVGAITLGGQRQQQAGGVPAAKTASQAAAAAASALAKSRQRQPSLLGSCKPLPPDDSPFIQSPQAASRRPDQLLDKGNGPGGDAGAHSRRDAASSPILDPIGQLDTLTPTVRGQLISSANCRASAAAMAPAAGTQASLQHQSAGGALASCQQQSAAAAAHAPPSSARAQPTPHATAAGLLQAPALASGSQSYAPQLGPPGGALAASRLQQTPVRVPSTLDEEEENMLYCSIEDNPSEHNYRVKVIETELALRCQLKCYQLAAPSSINEQYEELNQFRGNLLARQQQQQQQQQTAAQNQQLPFGQAASVVTFYQLIIGPQELTLLNDYATLAQFNNQAGKTNSASQQGLWSWPYQCIRRYGFDKDNCFMFEAGRKCASGPGQFVVQTPKAYHIYQDVVKFVNELRTITTTSSIVNNNINNFAQELPKSAHLQLQPGGLNHKSVTQIPVVWAPKESASPKANRREMGEKSGPPLASMNKTSDEDGLPSSRKQFFQTLRQIDSNVQQQQFSSQNHNSGNQPKSATRASCQEQPNEQLVSKCRPKGEAKLSPLSSGSSAGSSSSSCSVTSEHEGQPANMEPERPLAPVKASVSQKQASEINSDETDESGYEQGDDQRSTDSCQRSILPKNTSEATNGSPGQPNPVAARTRRQQQQHQMDSGKRVVERKQAAPVRVLPNNAGKPQRQQLNTSLADRVRALGLHDLLPKRPTNEPSNSIPTGAQSNRIAIEEDFDANLIRDVYCEITKLHAKFAVTTNGSGDDSMSSRSSSSSSGGELLSSSVATEEDEPMLLEDKRAIANREPMYSNVEAELDFMKEIKLREQQKQQQHRTINNDSNDKSREKLAPQHTEHLDKSYINNCPSSNHFSPLARHLHYPTLLNPIPESADDELSNNSIAQREFTSSNHYKKKPTNHYVINDVQYAKISRSSTAQ